MCHTLYDKWECGCQQTVPELRRCYYELCTFNIDRTSTSEQWYKRTVLKAGDCQDCHNDRRWSKVAARLFKRSKSSPPLGLMKIERPRADVGPLERRVTVAADELERAKNHEAWVKPQLRNTIRREREEERRTSARDLQEEKKQEEVVRPGFTIRRKTVGSTMIKGDEAPEKMGVERKDSAISDTGIS